MTDDVASTPVSQLTGAEVETVRPDASLVEVARSLVAADVGAVVMGDPAKVTGIVSERDVVRAVARGADLSQVTAREVAATDLVWCEEDSTIGEVAREMLERWVRHVLVESDGRLDGIVSARDLLGAFASIDAEVD